MSTRVQKGGTLFRPVTKARPRAIDSTSTQSSVSLDNRVLHPPSEEHKTPLSVPSDNALAIVISPPSTVLPQFSLQGSIDHTFPAAIANTTKQGVPIVISSARLTPVAQATESRPPSIVEETTASAGPSRAEVPNVEQTHPQGKRRSRSESLATTSPKKHRKARRPTTPGFDADADRGEDLDPTSITMAALCEDTGQGRISSKAAQILDNHLAWKKSSKEKRTRMRTLMEAKKYGRNEDGDNTQMRLPEAESDGATPGEPSTQPVSGNPSAVEDTSGQGFDYSKNVATSRYNVQVRIGPSGETIIDEESLFVDRNAEADTTEYTHVEESDVTKFVNSATYAKRFRGSRWSAEETELFYDALSQFGENYELISYVLPARDRKACKNKFKTEDKKNPQRINYCLNNRKPYDIQTLSRMTGKDFSGPTPEIRAPAALSLAESQNNSETNQPPVPGQTLGSSSTTVEHVEEVVGDISSFDPV
ncbi:hypothetical protein JVT61DRAFT_5234 [Boletus reticuloceps]|uniref:Myb-like domain-containing protein n=1 Tax=Boletus reticuloceps TaxID=495285 RepID=A0A8I2Z114_9AGAM|nr:hypothetical protein JVT61DRAFT_5234 [Boletus reticuloceps]